LITNCRFQVIAYVVQDWCHLSILKFLGRVTERGGFDNLTKVLMDALKKHVSVSDTYVAVKILAFGIDNVNVFQKVRNGVTCQQ
jgi:hypothetical protein